MAKRIIVCQTGSRHRYLIPQVLENAGLLYRLYTDSTRFSFLGNISTLLSKLGIKHPSIQRLSRRIPSIPKHKLFSTDFHMLRTILFSVFHKGDSFEKRNLFYTGFEYKCITWGIGEADCIYSMYIENFEFLKYAKQKGLKVVVDIFETPMTYKHLIEEIKSNPEYQIFDYQIQGYQHSHDVRMKYLEELLELADFYTIPSKFVITSMHEFKNYRRDKTLFLPYASSITTKENGNKPIKHRLIWVGNDPVRKGLLYCAKAAEILKTKYTDLDFRVIGVVNEKLKNTYPFTNMNFIGILNKEQLMVEYQSAEAYVFPTLYEGFAGTIIEAASCGTPIITTDASGADPDEFPAIFVPTKDVMSIVEAAISVFENQEYRNLLSDAVYEYASNLTPGIYAKKLVKYLENV